MLMTLKLIISAATGLLGGLVAYRYRDAIRKVLCPRPSGSKESHDKNEDSAHLAPLAQMEIQTPEPVPQNSSVSQAAAAFTPDASALEGCYEALHKADTALAQDNGDLEKVRSVLAEWNVRMNQRADDVRAWWSTVYATDTQQELQTCIGHIREMLVQAGVERDVRQSIVVDASTPRSYYDWESRPLLVGETVKVVSPAWTQQGHCIEKGIVKH